MDQILCAVRDQAINQFVNIFAVRSQGEAIRSFADEVNNPQSALNKHPEDYELFQVGTFDQDTGIIKALTAPTSLGAGKTLLR